MLTIGVTGHREITQMNQVISGVDLALLKIKESFPSDEITIISPLAEGADRLVVLRAEEKYEVHLTVPLPLEVSDYMRDFNTVASRDEFTRLLEQADQIIELPAGETREASYLASGFYLLNNSDVLVAIWDGHTARGTGGTGQIVAEARKKLIPIAWIFSDDGASHSLSQSRKKPGEVTYENFP